MELEFEKTIHHCLGIPVCEVQNGEQTQEIRLTDDLPDVGKVIGAWGQAMVRSKEWRSDCVVISGGMTVWVMYRSEQDGDLRTIDCWVPFQMKWDIPSDLPDGTIRICCRTRFVDARSVNPRKIMVRAGLGVLCQVTAPMTFSTYTPPEDTSAVELLCEKKNVQIPVEAGEKMYQLEERLEFSHGSDSVGGAVYYVLRPEITDQKIVGNKVAFRGNGNLHALFRQDDGKLFSQDFPLPFTQFAELDDIYGSESAVSVYPCVTSLELEKTQEGEFSVRAGLTAQYLVLETRELDVTEDAYSAMFTLNCTEDTLRIPVMCPEKREKLRLECRCQEDSSTPIDILLLPDFPRTMRTDTRMEYLLPGFFQSVGYNDSGEISAVTGRWEASGGIALEAGESALVIPGVPSEPQVTYSGGVGVIHAELPVDISVSEETGMEVITGIAAGEAREPDPLRPSLVICRAGSSSLWDIAKNTGSTMASIRKANGMEGDPVPGQMLLIPIA